MRQYQRFPLTMNHPSFQPGTISDDNAVGRGGNAPPGRAVMFPPVVVNNEDQEAYYQSRGYVSPNTEAGEAAFVRNQAAPVPPGYTGPRQYPRWENGRVVQDPNAAAADNTWPMYVVPPGKERDQGVIVKGPAEYADVMGRPYAPACPEAEENLPTDELAEFRAWKAAREAEKAATMAEADERGALIALARERNVKIDKRWSVERLRETVAASA